MICVYIFKNSHFDTINVGNTLFQKTCHKVLLCCRQETEINSSYYFYSLNYLRQSLFNLCFTPTRKLKGNTRNKKSACRKNHFYYKYYLSTWQCPFKKEKCTNNYKIQIWQLSKTRATINFILLITNSI